MLSSTSNSIPHAIMTCSARCNSGAVVRRLLACAVLSDCCEQIAEEDMKRSLLLAAAGAGIGLALFKNLRKLDLREKVVLITGGSRGLGFALARECASRGSHLILCARNMEELEGAGQKLSHS